MEEFEVTLSTVQLSQDLTSTHWDFHIFRGSFLPFH